MNAVEIDAAISALALQPFDAAEFPFAFLAAFGNKDTTIKRLRSGNNNASDLPGGVLQRNNIHLAVCETGSVGETLKSLRADQFREMNCAKTHTLILPGVSSEGREYLPVVLIDNHSVVSNLAFALYDAPRWNMALIASRLHLVWVGTVCGKLKTDYRYSNTLGWNTFPVPLLTEQNKTDLTTCAENILLAREAHFPATIADLYDPDDMPDNLRHAHERNDEVLERIYIGRRFRNDTERLEKLFDLYVKMTALAKNKPAAKAEKGRKA